MVTAQREVSAVVDPAAIGLAIIGKLPIAVRLVALQQDAMTAPLLTFYMDGMLSDRDREAVEILSIWLGKYNLLGLHRYHFVRVDRPQVVNYDGQCLYIKKESWDIREPLFNKEHSMVTRSELEKLFRCGPPLTILKTYHQPGLNGYGQLVDLHQHIGFYFNPTTKMHIPTTRVGAYRSNNTIIIIPAVVNDAWLTTLYEDCATADNLQILQEHVSRQLHTALLGRTMPQLMSVDILWEYTPWVLRFYVNEDITDADQAVLESVWIEILVGFPKDVELLFDLVVHEP